MPRHDSGNEPLGRDDHRRHAARPLPQGATEFSFFLAIPTLIGAGAYSLWKERALLSAADLPLFLVGFGFSFVFAWLCVRWLLRYVSTHTFVPFAWYRIAFGVVVLAPRGAASSSGRAEASARQRCIPLPHASHAKRPFVQLDGRADTRAHGIPRSHLTRRRLVDRPSPRVARSRRGDPHPAGPAERPRARAPLCLRPVRAQPLPSACSRDGRLQPGELERWANIDPSREIALVALVGVDDDEEEVGFRARRRRGRLPKGAGISRSSSPTRGRVAASAGPCSASSSRPPATRARRRLSGITLAENHGMVALARRLGFRVRREAGDATVLRLELALSD
jgi:hypothetical protein